jgi:hypothetical protein
VVKYILCGRLCGKRESTAGVHDQINPEHLN